MAMPSFVVVPTSTYGQANDKYGTNITQYNTAPNTTGFPPGAGLRLGQFGLLFDGTIVRLLAAGGTIGAANAAVSAQVGNGNDYTVIITPATVNTYPVAGTNDRSGISLSSGDYVWMTIYGNCTIKVAASQTATQFLVSSGTAGVLTGPTAGASLQANIIQLATTTTAASVACVIR